MGVDLFGKQENVPTTLQECSSERKEAVFRALRLLGADQYDLLLPETHSLPHLMKPGETPLGIVYGRYWLGGKRARGRGLLVATDKRILFLDKKPLYLYYDEVTYDVVSGVMYGHAGPASSVTLNTRNGDIRIRTFNGACARQFVRAVEDILFSQDVMGAWKELNHDNY